MESVLDSGKIVGDRYRILYELGRGSWGRTYVAEEIAGEGDRCVLKAFASAPSDPFSLTEVAERLERQIEAFSQLQHSQLPRFRAVLRAPLAEQECLFLVRDYVEGLSYQELLQTRRQQGRCLSEMEVRELLAQILPVLAHLHQQGIIHQNIAPENLILRHRDRLPVLLDFGGLQAAIGSPDSDSTPDEPAPHSDLYALAVTAVVLLTGRDSPQLLPSDRDGSQLPVSSGLREILQRMLAPQPSDRFASAPEVVSALKACPTVAPPTINVPELELPPYPPPPPFRRRLLRWGGKTTLVLLLSAAAGAMGWLAGNAWIDSQVNRSVPPSPSTAPSVRRQPQSLPEALSFPPKGDLESERDEDLPTSARARQQAWRDRLVQLGIDKAFFVALLDEQFKDRYPLEAERVLSDTSEDDVWRDRRAEMASDLLDRLGTLRPEARSQLGRYSQIERDRWVRAANSLRVSSRALFDLADAQFLYNFPEQAGRDFREQNIGQVWSAIAFSQLQALQSGAALTEIVLAPGELSKRVSRTLEPGTGQVLIANLTASQLLDLSLDANSATLLSIYSPTGNLVLLEDSSDRSWSGELLESGFYEFVVISKSSEPLDYSLTLTVRP